MNPATARSRAQELMRSLAKGKAPMSIPTARIYQTAVKLVAGDNHVILDVPSMSIEQISLKATCNAQLKNLFHGAQNLLSDQEPIEISKLPEGWRLQSIPAEEFHEGFPTTLLIRADSEGELTILFSEKAS